MPNTEVPINTGTQPDNAMMQKLKQELSAPKEAHNATPERKKTSNVPSEEERKKGIMEIIAGLKEKDLQENANKGKGEDPLPPYVVNTVDDRVHSPHLYKDAPPDYNAESEPKSKPVSTLEKLENGIKSFRESSFYHNTKKYLLKGMTWVMSLSVIGGVLWAYLSDKAAEAGLSSVGFKK